MLYGCENNDLLFGLGNKGEAKDKGIDDRWYEYLLNRISDSTNWEDFDPSWLSIVTFNYDQSLEYFLSVALQSIYGKTANEVQEKLKSLTIAHVYGRLGRDANTLDSYGKLFDDQYDISQEIATAVTNIHLIEEGRSDDDRLNPIREIISKSERIGFLGFEFDKTNIERISTDGIFKSIKHKQIAGTAFGFTTAEITRTMIWLGSTIADQPLAFTPTYKIELLDKTCLPLLRETLILDR